MSKGPSFVRMYPSDWRSGCLGLSLEQEGLYVRMCMFIAETGRRVPLDDTEAARMMGVQTRNYRRVLGELLRIGKIKRHDGGYGNDRIEFERERAQAGLQKAADDSEHPTSSGVGADRETDQGQGREDHAATVGNHVTTPVERRCNADITAVAAEKTQCFLRANKEPEPEIKKEPPTPLRGPTPLEALGAFEAWNATAARCGLAQAAKITPDRQRKIIARLRDYGTDGWGRALANIERSSFLTGKNDRGWRADLDFLLQPASFSKVHDGTYGSGRHAGPATPEAMSPHEIAMQREADEARRMGLI